MLAGGLVAALLGSPLGIPSAGATAGDIGYRRGGTYTGEAPTADKPQSKLWFNDGSWWADMLTPGSSSTWHIFRLDRTTHTWVDTGTPIDDRPATHADALWDGTHLYVASNVVASSSTGNVKNRPARLYRYTYNGPTAPHPYTKDTGFPVNINNYSSESLSLDKDSKGVLWATWTQNRQVYVNSTAGSDTAWGTPFVPQLNGKNPPSLAADDISAIAAYGKTRMGLMWSNQSNSTFYFAYHQDGAGRGSWTVRTAYSAPNIADDHINLKQLEGDDLGHLYAAVKTSLDATSSQDERQNLLLALNPSGNWTATTFGTVADCHTRPMIVLDSENKVVHMFATAPSTGSGCPGSGTPGTIYEKTTKSFSDLSFPGDAAHR